MRWREAARAWPVIAVLVAAATAAADSRPDDGLTRPVATRMAFTLPVGILSADELRTFVFGNRLFNTNWTVAPASVGSFDGLGPTFNRVSCSGCHLRDGRGRPPDTPGAPMLSMLIRLSVEGSDAHGGPQPHPSYGDQLNDRAIPGVPAEGRAVITWREAPGHYADGERYSLRAPRFAFRALRFGPLGPAVRLSARVAPPVIGLGLLEAIADETLEGLADSEDQDGDGISGRVNRVWDVAARRTVPGRFGWKANAPTLRQQAAAAALGDLGLTTSLFPRENCPPVQRACRAAPSGGDPELPDEFLDKLTHYVQTLAVPSPRGADEPRVQTGARLFSDLGCARCHVPALRTGVHPTQPGLSHRDIHPYTDLLLHDLGDGLADGRPDFEASGREWRTPPLWGIGLVPVVNGHAFLLHDGRARGLAEAILWHGGEAEPARERFRSLPREDREAVLTFLRSL